MKNSSNNNQTKQDSQVKLQVVYKPPFKFSVKLKKPTEVATNVVKEINSRVSQKQQRNALHIKQNNDNRVEKKRNQDRKRKTRHNNLTTNNEIINEMKPIHTKLDDKLNKDVISNKNILKNDDKGDIDNFDKKRRSITNIDKIDSNVSNNVPNNLNKEPIYENTNLTSHHLLSASDKGSNEQSCSKSSDKYVDLLRMTSVECRAPCQPPITPEECPVVIPGTSNKQLIRNNSLKNNDPSTSCENKNNKRLKRELSKENKSKNIYSNLDSNVLQNIKFSQDLMRFPSVEASNGIASTSTTLPSHNTGTYDVKKSIVPQHQIPTISDTSHVDNSSSVPKRHSISSSKNLILNSSNSNSNLLLVDSDLDSNIHTVPSDLEVLLSESEYLFSADDV